MTRFELLGLAFSLAAVAACGGKSSRDGGDDGPDSAGTTGAGGTSSGGSSTGGTAGIECRVYAARYTIGSDEETTCAFDRPSLSLRCATSAGESMITSWDTLEAAMLDNQPVGRITFATRVYDGPNCHFTNTMAYDASGRPSFQVATAAPEYGCGNDGGTYTGWDDFGRPLAAVANGVGAIACDRQSQQFEYHDASHTMAVTTTGGTGDQCHDTVFTWIFDQDGLPTRVMIELDGVLSARDYVTLETGRICRD